MTQAAKNMQKLFKEQDGKCFYCNVAMMPRHILKMVGNAHYKKNKDIMPTFDHIKLAKAGGTYAKENGVCACHLCNSMRGDLPQDTFIEHFDLIREEWHAGNRNTKFLPDGELIWIASKKYKRMLKTRVNRSAGFRKGGYILARFAGHLGITVDDLFLHFVYNNSRLEMIADIE